jgi:hypothetical protein
MRSFPDGHTGDSLMALWFAFSEIRDRMGDRIIVPAEPYDPPPEEPITEQGADQKFIDEQEAVRSNDSAITLKRQADRSLARSMLPWPSDIDADIQNTMEQKVQGGMNRTDAKQWAWTEQLKRSRKKFYNGEALIQFKNLKRL